MKNSKRYALEADLLQTPVEGCGLEGPSLGDQIAEGRTLLVFLRHFG